MFRGNGASPGRFTLPSIGGRGLVIVWRGPEAPLELIEVELTPDPPRPARRREIGRVTVPSAIAPLLVVALDKIGRTRGRVRQPGGEHGGQGGPRV